MFCPNYRASRINALITVISVYILLVSIAFKGDFFSDLIMYKLFYFSFL